MTTATASASPITNVRRLGTAAAIAAGCSLIVKVAVIAATSGTAPSIVTSTLYILGVTLPLIAAAGIASRRNGRAAMIGSYVAVVLASLFFIMSVSDALEGVVEIFTDKLYLIEELPLAVLGLIWLIVGLNMRAHDRS